MDSARKAGGPPPESMAPQSGKPKETSKSAQIAQEKLGQSASVQPQAGSVRSLIAKFQGQETPSQGEAKKRAPPLKQADVKGAAIGKELLEGKKAVDELKGKIEALRERRTAEAQNSQPKSTIPNTVSSQVKNYEQKMEGLREQQGVLKQNYTSSKEAQGQIASRVADIKARAARPLPEAPKIESTPTPPVAATPKTAQEKLAAFKQQTEEKLQQHQQEAAKFKESRASKPEIPVGPAPSHQKGIPTAPTPPPATAAKSAPAAPKAPKAPAPPVVKPGGGPGALFDQIKAGTTLKKAPTSGDHPSSSSVADKPLSDSELLANKLSARNAAMKGGNKKDDDDFWGPAPAKAGAAPSKSEALAPKVETPAVSKPEEKAAPKAESAAVKQPPKLAGGIPTPPPAPPPLPPIGAPIAHKAPAASKSKVEPRSVETPKQSLSDELLSKKLKSAKDRDSAVEEKKTPEKVDIASQMRKNIEAAQRLADQRAAEEAAQESDDGAWD